MRPDAAPHGAAEQRLLDAARRSGRHARPGQALVVHLSALLPPAPRPHHGRIARAMLHDAAQRQGGEVLAMGNGDLVLLCPGTAQAAAAAGDGDLPGLLARLLQADAADPVTLVSLWPLPAMSASLLAYAAARGFDPPGMSPGMPSGAGHTGTPAAAQTGAVDALAALADAAQVTDLLRRQTAILLPGPRRRCPPRSCCRCSVKSRSRSPGWRRGWSAARRRAPIRSCSAIWPAGSIGACSMC